MEKIEHDRERRKKHTEPNRQKSENQITQNTNTPNCAITKKIIIIINESSGENIEQNKNLVGINCSNQNPLDFTEIIFGRYLLLQIVSFRSKKFNLFFFEWEIVFISINQLQLFVSVGIVDFVLF